jgi:DNA-binding MarR family transcriptional regulator
MIELKLDQSEAELIMGLCCHGKVYQAKIADALGMEKKRVGRVIDEIETKMTMAGFPIDAVIQIKRRMKEGQPVFPEFEK